MKMLKRLTLSFTLVSLVAVATFAGETLNPPCAPGETQGPPCSQSAPGSTDPGETSGPPASVDVTTIVEAVAVALSLF